MTMGKQIARLRKAKGMTQLELAEKMGVTDKAVSKWERDLSCPDVSTLPKLSEALGVRLEELMQAELAPEKNQDSSSLIKLICKAVSLAMGVAVTVLSVLGQLEVSSGFTMLGIGLTGLAMGQFLE